MKIDRAAVKEARKRFERILEAQLGRVERLKEAPEWIDYRGLRPLRIGIIGGGWDRPGHHPGGTESTGDDSETGTREGRGPVPFH